MAGQLDTFRIGAMKDLYLPWEYGVFQEPLEGNTAQGTCEPDCLQLEQVFFAPWPPVFYHQEALGPHRSLFSKTG